MRHKSLSPLLQIERGNDSLQIGLEIPRRPPVHVLLAHNLQDISLLEHEARRLGRYELVPVRIVREQRLHVDLRGHGHVVVGRYHLERYASLGQSQPLLQLLGRAHGLSVYLSDYVAFVQQTLLVDHAAVHDSRDLQIAVLVHAHRDAQRLVVELANADHAHGVHRRAGVIGQRRGLLVLVLVLVAARRRRHQARLLFLNEHIDQVVVVVVVLLRNGVVGFDESAQVLVAAQEASELVDVSVAAHSRHWLQVAEQRRDYGYIVLAFGLQIGVLDRHERVEDVEQVPERRIRQEVLEEAEVLRIGLRGARQAAQVVEDVAVSARREALRAQELRQRRRRRLVEQVVGLAVATAAVPVAIASVAHLCQCGLIIKRNKKSNSRTIWVLTGWL